MIVYFILNPSNKDKMFDEYNYDEYNYLIYGNI